MAHQVPWNYVYEKEFIRVARLTNEEIEVLKTRLDGMTIKEQAEYLGMSVSKVNYITNRLKQKYDIAQEHSNILPPREFSVKDTYTKK